MFAASAIKTNRVQGALHAYELASFCTRKPFTTATRKKHLTPKVQSLVTKAQFGGKGRKVVAVKFSDVQEFLDGISHLGTLDSTRKKELDDHINLIEANNDAVMVQQPMSHNPEDDSEDAREVAEKDVEPDPKRRRLVQAVITPSSSSSSSISGKSANPVLNLNIMQVDESIFDGCRQADGSQVDKDGNQSPIYLVAMYDLVAKANGSSIKDASDATQYWIKKAESNLSDTASSSSSSPDSAKIMGAIVDVSFMRPISNADPTKLQRGKLIPCIPAHLALDFLSMMTGKGCDVVRAEMRNVSRRAVAGDFDLQTGDFDLQTAVATQRANRSQAVLIPSSSSSNSSSISGKSANPVLNLNIMQVDESIFDGCRQTDGSQVDNDGNQSSLNLVAMYDLVAKANGITLSLASTNTKNWIGGKSTELDSPSSSSSDLAQILGAIVYVCFKRVRSSTDPTLQRGKPIPCIPAHLALDFLSKMTGKGCDVIRAEMLDVSRRAIAGDFDLQTAIATQRANRSPEFQEMVMTGMERTEEAKQSQALAGDLQSGRMSSPEYLKHVMALEIKQFEMEQVRLDQEQAMKREVVTKEQVRLDKVVTKEQVRLDQEHKIKMAAQLKELSLKPTGDAHVDAVCKDVFVNWTQCLMITDKSGTEGGAKGTANFASDISSILKELGVRASEINGSLLSVCGSALAKRHRAEFNEEPPVTTKYVNGANRQVKTYSKEREPWMCSIVREVCVKRCVLAA